MSEKTLSDAQKHALKFSVYGPTGDIHYCETDDLVRASTLRSLVRKGYLSDEAAPYRYWLTDKGEAARESLLYRTCQNCEASTHHTEAACLNCGAMKDWAVDDAVLSKAGEAR